ncbi:MAG: spermidine synthase [Nitrospinae bacterium]|nr:spermidine synthase [Nitrospinota bacterium]
MADESARPARRAKVFSDGVFYILFAISGFSGLIYESIWTHYLKLFLGHAAYAQTLTLVIFMGGMALGAWGTSRVTGRLRRLLAAYALVEAVIGVFALGFHPAFVNVTQFAYGTVIPALPGPASVAAFKWILGAALIFPQTVLLGATFPLMSAGVIRLFPERPGRALASLYFSNSLGAAVGALVSGFYLVGAVGLPGTIMTAGVINFLVAAAVWALSREEIPAAAPAASGPASPASAPRALAAALLATAFLTGAASFMYEIGWIRMLTLVLGGSTHAFELMLSAFILGLALGGWWIRGRIDALADPVAALGAIQVAMGALALMTLVGYGLMFNVMSFIVHSLAKTGQGYFVFNLFSHALALAVMLPATTLAGMTLPVITRVLMARGGGEAAIGRVYAANTVGAIAGVAAAVQLLMPLLGLKSVALAGGFVDMALGVALLRGSTFGARRGAWLALTAGSAAFIAAVGLGARFDTTIMSSGVYRYGYLPAPGKATLYHRDGKTSSVDLFAQTRGNETLIALTTNGKPEAAVSKNPLYGDEPTMTLLAALPASIIERLDTAANIGLGSGMTSHSLLAVESLKRLDTIEIEPAMAEAARGFGARVTRVFNDPRSHIIIEDAKTYFASRPARYDLIISEPSNPWVSGVASLFSREFYRLARSRLNEGGVLAQWFQLYEADMEMLASVIKAMGASFPNMALYAANESDIIILAAGPGVDLTPRLDLAAARGLAPVFHRIGVRTARDLELRRLAGGAALTRLASRYALAPNSDYYPVLDLRAARARFLDTNAKDIHRLRAAPLPILEALDGQTPYRAPLEVTYTPYYANALRAGSAAAALAWATGAASAPPGPSLVSALVTLRAEPSQCGAPGMESAWRASLRQVMETALPYLTPGEMRPLVDLAKGSPCLERFGGRTKAWVNLYAAVAARDYEAMLAGSARLAPRGAIIASRDNNYLLGALTLSAWKTGRMDVARDAWRRYRTGALPPVELLTLFTLTQERGLGGVAIP